MILSPNKSHVGIHKALFGLRELFTRTRIQLHNGTANYMYMLYTPNVHALKKARKRLEETVMIGNGADCE